MRVATLDQVGDATDKTDEGPSDSGRFLAKAKHHVNSGEMRLKERKRNGLQIHKKPDDWKLPMARDAFQEHGLHGLPSAMPKAHGTAG